MKSLSHLSSLMSTMDSSQSRLASLAYGYKENEARTDIDDQLIDSLIATANALVVQATALKSIEYDPTPVEEVE